MTIILEFYCLPGLIKAISRHSAQDIYTRAHDEAPKEEKEETAVKAPKAPKAKKEKKAAVEAEAE